MKTIINVLCCQNVFRLLVVPSGFKSRIGGRAFSCPALLLCTLKYFLFTEGSCGSWSQMLLWSCSTPTAYIYLTNVLIFYYYYYYRVGGLGVPMTL